VRPGAGSILAGILLLLLLPALLPVKPALAAAVQCPMLFHSICNRCRQVLDYLDAHPDAAVTRYNLQEPENTALLFKMYRRYKVPVAEWDGSMALFTGEACITGEEKIKAWISKAGRACKTQASGKGDPYAGSAPPSLSLRLSAVALAGLADGINPCAFATFLLFASYLTLAGRGRRETLIVGLIFASGVFLAYLGIGWSVFRAIRAYAFDNSLGRTLNIIIGSLSLAAALYSFKDYRAAAGGRTGDIVLKLPKPLQCLKQRVLRNQLKRVYVVPAVFLAGLVVSLLELVCTGQIYLPTLAMIASTPGKANSALGYLLFYGAAFVTPLLILTLLVSLGIPALRMADWGRKAVPASKLILATIFLLMGLWLLFVSLY